MDLSNLSVAELRDLQQRIPQELKRREASERIAVLNEVKALAKARGFALEELVGKEAKASPMAGAKVKVKFRHPQDGSLEWTGRGRTPKWVQAWTQNGGSLDSLRV